LLKVFLDEYFNSEIEHYLSRFRKKVLISSAEDDKYSEPWDVVVLSERSFDKTTSIESLKNEFSFSRLFFVPSSFYSPRIHRDDVIVFSDKNTLVNNLISVLSVLVKNDAYKRKFNAFSIHREPVFAGDVIKGFLRKFKMLRNSPVSVLFVSENGSDAASYVRYLYPELEMEEIDCSVLNKESLRIFLEGDCIKGGFLNYPHQMLFINNIDSLEKDDLLYLYSFINLHADFPVVAACSKENRENVKSVMDLYDTVEIPPIRERQNDIPFIISALISQISQEHNLKLSFPTKRTLELCKSYSWPGNYTELRDFTQLYCLNGPLNALEAFLKGVEYIEKEDQLPDLNRFQAQLKMTTEEILVKKVMDLTQNNRKKAASLLGISYKSLSKKLKLYSNNDEG
jgi:hypothetical protein